MIIFHKMTAEVSKNNCVERYRIEYLIYICGSLTLKVAGEI